MKVVLKQYARLLKRNPLSSIISITGFASSIAVIIILVFFIIAEKSYDSDYKNIDNTYMVITTKNESFVEEDAKEILMDKYPQIGSSCRYFNNKTNFVYNHDIFETQMVTTDEGFFDVFSVHFVFGNKETAFSNIQGIVLTESLVKRIFKEKYPVGQFIKTLNGKEYQVSGIVKDLPKNSSITANCFIYYKSKIHNSSINNVALTKLFIVIKPGTDLRGLEQNISKTLIETSKILNNKVFVYGELLGWKLFPFKNAYFNTTIKKDHLQHANNKLILMISIISLIILVLAIINYVNLSVAALFSRVKEVGIRKTIGAESSNIFNQFLLESIITCVLASVLAFILAQALIPIFETILGKPVDFIKLNLLNCLLILSIVFLIGIISGIFPAALATKYSPIQILSMNKIIFKKSFFRNGLSTFQFTISIMMIICLLAIIKQVNYSQNMNIGFDTNCLIKVDYPENKDKLNVIKDYLSKNPNIIDVSFTQGSPMEIGQYSGNNKPINHIAIMSADDKFVDVFHLKVLLGRNINYPSNNKECIITENAFKESGWENLEGRIFFDHKVVGVVNTFNSDDLHQFASNIMVTNSTNDFSEVNIRIDSHNVSETLHFIKQVWETNFPDYGFRYTFYDEWLETMFNKEKNYARIALVFGILSIILSCLGLLGLAEHTIKQKIKEIGIRKINGAKTSEIMTMLNEDFIIWVIIAFIIASPIAWYVMNKWLQNFAYKTELSWWIFVAAGLTAMTVAVLTVSWQSWRAAMRNPVEALRYE